MSIDFESTRVLQFVPEPLPSYRADVSTLFGKYLPRFGVRCDLVGKAGQTSEPPPHDFASVTKPERRGGRLRQEFDFLALCLRRAWQVPRQQVDVIQVRDMVTIGLAVMLIAKLRGIPFAYWASFLMCDGRIERSRAELAKKFRIHYFLTLCKGLVEKFVFYKIVLRNANHVFVQSEAMKRHMVNHGIRAERLTAVPMGIDTELLRADALAPRRLPGWENIPVVAYLGTLDRSREINILIDALAALRRKLPAARLLLIGSSPTPSDHDDWLAHARRLGLEEAVAITGWLPGAEAQSLLLGADAAISYIPRNKLFDVSSPTKLLEYLALGLPAIGNDSPDQHFVLTASAAGWLTASTAEDFAQAMHEILADVETARARARQGRAFIEQHRSYRVLAESLAQRYRVLATA
ncbi:glycosyltransferase [Massilia sp. METH4]|uniref:glycosyltransferase n=1 Tax=Massilia sp. METH4 TaxID=3123041 RepID=UPI0030CFCB50